MVDWAGAMAVDPFFLVTVAGVLAGVALAFAFVWPGGTVPPSLDHSDTRRTFRRRVIRRRPVLPLRARHRRAVGAPLLVTGAVAAIGGAFLVDGAVIVEWWPWAVALFLISATVVALLLLFTGWWVVPFLLIPVFPIVLAVAAWSTAVPVGGPRDGNGWTGVRVVPADASDHRSIALMRVETARWDTGEPGGTPSSVRMWIAPTVPLVFARDDEPSVDEPSVDDPSAGERSPRSDEPSGDAASQGGPVVPEYGAGRGPWSPVVVMPPDTRLSITVQYRRYPPALWWFPPSGDVREVSVVGNGGLLLRGRPVPAREPGLRIGSIRRALAGVLNTVATTSAVSGRFPPDGTFIQPDWYMLEVHRSDGLGNGR